MIRTDRPAVVVLYEGRAIDAEKTFRESREASEAGQHIIRLWWSAPDYQDISNPQVVAFNRQMAAA
jgi:hypothetical protein